SAGGLEISTTSASPANTTPHSELCVGCRSAMVVSPCSECIPGDIQFIERGDKCIAKSSTGEFNRGGETRVKGELNCISESGKFVWRTEGGEKVSQFAAIRSMDEKPASASSKRMLVIVGIVLLLICGLIGTIAFVMWYKKRNVQKREAAKIKGLEQKNDDVLDAVISEEPKTLILW
ncbi:hypothetical protein PFISCL1PPCAC_17298, partial [Pristionchus fissidentatus]